VLTLKGTRPPTAAVPLSVWHVEQVLPRNRVRPLATLPPPELLELELLEVDELLDVDELLLEVDELLLELLELDELEELLLVEVSPPPQALKTAADPASRKVPIRRWLKYFKVNTLGIEVSPHGSGCDHCYSGS